MLTVSDSRIDSPVPFSRAAATSGRSPWFSMLSTSATLSNDTEPSASTSVTRTDCAPVP